MMEYLKSDPMFFGYANKKYKENWERMFGKKDQKEKPEEEEECQEEKDPT
jgi:hypothetical protein